ncbi:MAG: iditol 2-dehydrogenase [Betaproteobacteria bacterium RIFCSPLOWO2_12_FULL_68_19]|nr:MAG: iditol 2-dehydrogenase [Betaproteobacteria bacterium RIFCSPLOWO2_12_FULL_68_19]
MRGAVFLGNRKVELRSFPDPTPGEGEVVIQMKASGMCGSDLKFYRSPPGEAQAALGLGNLSEPFIAGHEPCGVVVARGPGVSEREAPIGSRVMDHHYAGCGVCKHCRVGWSQLCRAGITVYGVTAHGGHAEYLKVPARTLVPLPQELSFAEGAAVSCGTGTAYGALRRMRLAGGDTLAVFGQGPVGLSATLLGAAMGARVIAVETGAERLALAKQFGADAIVDATQKDPVKSILEYTKGEGVALSLDCSGAAAARLAAVRATRTWGTACFIGEGGEVTLDVSRDLLRKQLTVIGSWTFSAMGQAECARFVADNRIGLERIFSHRWKLEQADEAYRSFDTQTTGKGVFLL